MFTGSIPNEYTIQFPPMRLSLTEDKSKAKWKYKNTEIPPNCPRCASSNTKFCYYNNYSLAQPRYFCKGCRRYWTKGGSLRNVPVGGGYRKGRRARANRRDGGASATTALQSTGESEHRADIDLAAMFAKYVSKSVGNENYIPGSNLMGGVHDQFTQGVPEFSIDGINGQDFVYQDPNALEMQNLLAADISRSERTNFPDFRSQESTLKVHDFGMVSTYDQLIVSENHVAGNWGPFDLSAYEIFSSH